VQTLCPEKVLLLNTAITAYCNINNPGDHVTFIIILAAEGQVKGRSLRSVGTMRKVGVRGVTVE